MKLFVYKTVKCEVINVEFLSRDLHLRYSTFPRRGRTSYGRTSHFMEALDNPLETMLYYLTLISL